MPGKRLLSLNPVVDIKHMTYLASYWHLSFLSCPYLNVYTLFIKLKFVLNLQAEAELGKSRTPSPPTVQAISPYTKPNNTLDTYKPNHGFGNGFAELSVNGLDGSEQGRRTEKDHRTQEYLEKIIPVHKASQGGRLVRDILVAQQ